MAKLRGICYIIGACGEYCNDISITPTENDFVIAADGGYDILRRKNINADVLLGDFDSISNLPNHKCIIKHPVKKDDTDTFLAYKTAFSNGYKNFVILGGVGGRFDHTIANIQTLLHIAENNGRAFLVGDNCIMTTIHNSEITFSKEQSGNISVFAQGKIAENVTIKGLKYNAEGILLNPSIPMGVSNEFVGERAEISVKDGSLLVVWFEKFENFIKNIENYTLK